MLVENSQRNSFKLLGSVPLLNHFKRILISLIHFQFPNSSHSFISLANFCPHNLWRVFSQRISPASFCSVYVMQVFIRFFFFFISPQEPIDATCGTRMTYSFHLLSITVLYYTNWMSLLGKNCQKLPHHHPPLTLLAGTGAGCHEPFLIGTSFTNERCNIKKMLL